MSLWKKTRCPVCTPVAANTTISLLLPPQADANEWDLESPLPQQLRPKPKNVRRAGEVYTPDAGAACDGARRTHTMCV